MTVTFTKERILASKRYRTKRDALTVLLKADKPYTFEEVDTALAEFYGTANSHEDTQESIPVIESREQKKAYENITSDQIRTYLTKLGVDCMSATTKKALYELYEKTFEGGHD